MHRTTTVACSRIAIYCVVVIMTISLQGCTRTAASRVSGVPTPAAWKEYIQQSNDMAQHYDASALLVSGHIDLITADANSDFICDFTYITNTTPFHIRYYSHTNQLTLDIADTHLLSPNETHATYQQWNTHLLQSVVQPSAIVERITAEVVAQGETQSSLIMLSLYGHQDFEALYGTPVIWAAWYRTNTGIHSLVIHPVSQEVLKRDTP